MAKGRIGWRRCSRAGCKAFYAKQYTTYCKECGEPLRGATSDDVADIDTKLLVRTRDRLADELAQVDQRIAELTALRRGR